MALFVMYALPFTFNFVLVAFFFIIFAEDIATLGNMQKNYCKHEIQ